MSKVTFNAVLKRLNRKLRHEGETIRVSRSRNPWAPSFFHVDVNHNVMLAELSTRDTVEAWARELGVLQAHETIEASS